MSDFEQEPGNIEIATQTPNPWEEIAIPRLDTAFTPPTIEQPITITKEALVEQAELVVGIDRAKLQALELPAKLEHLRETFMRLPERLEFRPGVNLIFGPNGSGKTTFARAINYAIESEARYQGHIEEGKSEEEARKWADSTFELPRNRGTSFEEYITAGAAPLIASTLRIEEYATNTCTIYCNSQEQVGRHMQLNREMARQPRVRDIGPFFEISGDAHSSDELLEDASQNLSARQTVDRDIEGFLDISFSLKWNAKDDGSIELPDWEIPEEFSKMSRHKALGRFGLNRKRKYYPGIAFIDEPETGMDVQRHLALPNNIKTWYPEGSIMVVPTNSTELYRSNHSRIDLTKPELGIFTPTS